MTSPDDGGLELESMAYERDTGSGALIIDENGKHRLVGVMSRGGYHEWGSWHQYTYASGYHIPWIEANIASPYA